MADCIFCKIVKGEIPSKKVYEGDKVLAFHDINPAAPIHILIIPRRHISSLSEAKEKDKDVLGEIQVVAARVAKKAGITDAFRLLVASGSEAGQTVFHLHYHLIGGWGKKAPKMEVKQDKFP
jgi:histidine triad (HIT) family protein